MMGRYLIVANKLPNILVFRHERNKDLRDVALMPVGRSESVATLSVEDWRDSLELEKLIKSGSIDVTESDQPAEQPWEPSLDRLKPFQRNAVERIVFSDDTRQVNDLIDLEPRIGTMNDPGELDRSFLRSEHLTTLKVAQEWLDALPKSPERARRIREIKKRIEFIKKEL